MTAAVADELPRELPTSMVGRMTLILDAFAGVRGRLNLEEVARATHLPRTTAHRILDQLVQLEWLDHSAFGYELGRRSLGLSGAAGNHDELRATAAPVLYELVMTTGLVAHLAVLDGAEIRYLDKVGGRRAAEVPSKVGGTAPAYSTALGRAMLAWIDPLEVEELLGGPLRRRTSTTVASLSALYLELHRIRGRRGLALERGETFASIGCVAAAIRGARGPLAAISLVGPADAGLERVAPLVLRAARQIRDELGGR